MEDTVDLQIWTALSEFAHESDSLFTCFTLRTSGMDTWQSILMNNSGGSL